MTGTWAHPPTGRTWRHLDEILHVAAPIVAAESRFGGVHQIRWEPARRTRVAFERPDGDLSVVEVTVDGVRRRRLVDDAALTGVRQMLQPADVAARMSHALGVRVSSCSVTPISYRPRSRCVLRVDARTTSGTVTVYVKLLAEGLDRYVAGHRAVSAATEPGSSPLVPELLAVWTDLQAVVTLAVPGVSASERLRDDLSIDQRVALAESMGAMLAQIHRAMVPREVRLRHRGPLDELAELDDYLPAAWHADATCAASFTWTLNALHADLPTTTSTAFSHGSFRPGQVVVDEDRLTVLDLDGVATADPARDLGNAMAYLDWARVRHADDRPSLSEAVHRGYVVAGGKVPRAALDWWRAAALMKIAGRRYRSLDTKRWPLVPTLVQSASMLVASPGLTRVQMPITARPDIADPESMTQLLRPVLAAHALTRDPHVVHAETLREAPGRRVVMRYRVVGLDADPVEIIAKAFADPSRADMTLTNLNAFSQSNDDAGRIRTQEALGVLPDHGVVVFRATNGHPVPDLPEDDAVEAAGRAAAWLRGVHGGRQILSRTFDLGRELTNLGIWAQEIGRVNDRLTKPARELEERLEAAAPRLPVVATSPIHKDFHLAHVIVDAGGNATIIDLDEARMGDPLFDVAHACANCDALDRPWAAQMNDAFLAGYGTLPGPEPEERMRFFSAYAHLKITRQRVRNDPREMSDGVIDAAVDLLERGASCLDR